MNNSSQVHSDKLLTTFAGKTAEQSDFTHDAIFKPLPVAKESDKYTVFKSEDINANINLNAADKDTAKETVFGSSEQTYICVEKKIKTLITQRMMDNWSQAGDIRQYYTKRLMGQVKVALEAEVQAHVISTSAYAYDTPAVKWDAASAVVIEKNLDTWKEAMFAKCGKEPNNIVIPAAVAKVVKRDSTVRDLIKYTQSDLLVNGDLPPTMFNMKVIIPGAIKNSANLGQTESFARIWATDSVFMFYTTPGQPGIDELCLGFQPVVNANGRSNGFKVDRWVANDPEGEWIRVSYLGSSYEDVTVGAGCVGTDVLT
jgi:hypothetical protein